MKEQDKNANSQGVSKKEQEKFKGNTLHVSCKLPGEPISKGLLMSVKGHSQEDFADFWSKLC